MQSRTAGSAHVPVLEVASPLGTFVEIGCQLSIWLV